MSRADQTEGTLTTIEDSVPCLRSPKGDPPLQPRSRPLSDIYPFQSHAERTAAPSLLSGCVTQIQPVTSDPHSEESRLNGINSSAWSSPVIGQPDDKPQPSRIMRLFSNPKKCPVLGHSPSTDSPSPLQGSHGSGGPQAWPGLSGLAVMDSFKKLRSSVLQGIQSRGTANHDEECTPTTNQQLANGLIMSNQGSGPGLAANSLTFSEGCTVSNGHQFAVTSQYGSDYEDCDVEDVEDEEENGLQRNIRFNRSIRRAFGAGRITLLDTGQGRRGGNNKDVVVRSEKRAEGSGSEVDSRAEGVNVNTNVKVMRRLSKSAENLNLFKTSFRRKAPSPSPTSPGPDSPETSRPNRTLSLQRTASASSVDVRGRSSVPRCKSPLKAKGQMLKLMGSMTDITSRRRHSRSPGPSPTSPLSPLSRLHDDYSRRLPCLPASERQRRPSPARTRSAGESTDRRQPQIEYTPVLHPPPDSVFGPVQHQVHISTVSVENAEGKEQASLTVSSYDALAVTSTSCYTLTAEYHSPPLNLIEPSGSKDQTNVTSQPKEATSDHNTQEALLHAEAGGSTPPLSPVSSTESSSSPGEASTSSTESTPSANPRRRAARARPRPISAYGQLVSRKVPIPEEEAELHPDERITNGTSCRDYNSNDSCASGDSPDGRGVNGDLQSRKQRPVSVIGGEELFSSPGTEEKEPRLPSPLSRPPVPSHQVPPYRAVSARFRPSTLSQSTPIGLDRLGRHKIHRVLSDDASESLAAFEDSVSEEDGSFDELSDGTPYLQSGVELPMLNEWISAGHTVYAEALWDHVSMEEQELAFKAGDVIRVLDASHKDWWWGRGVDREAWFPSTFVRLRVNQEDSSGESVESIADQEEPAPRDTHSSQHKEQMRTNVVQEIMNTERIYIKHLRDICEGYIRQCRKHPTMFTEEQLKTIFSNIEDIYRFQRLFLRDLEKKYNKDQPHLSEIGSCFLLQGEGFSIYSDYCNTHPAACAELQRLMKLGRYKHFFEACRLLQQMIDISIAGFLLTPVQKICKYPLQLGELLKYTPKDHSDYSGVSNAYEAMKNVASLINEGKRRLESVDAIAHWQVAILHWEGADALERSSELIHSGELTRVVRQGKAQQRHFFLFDHQLVFCKKDILRRDLFHYRGRLDMDQTEVVEQADGRDPDMGLSLRNALRLRNASTLETLCVLSCRKAQDKQRWLQAFAKERRRVQEDQEMGIEISEEQRKKAIFNARKAKQGKIKTTGFSDTLPPHHQNLHPLHQRHVTVPTSVPEQQVFSLAEPPKRKPSHLWYTFTRSTFFRK